MSETASEFERLLGRAALRLWSDLPRDVQEKLFETAVPLDPGSSKPFSDISSRPSSKDGTSPQAQGFGVTERDHGFGGVHWVARTFAMVVA
jgi:hypothetical protein